MLYHFPESFICSCPRTDEKFIFSSKRKVEEEEGTTPFRDKKCYIAKTE